MIIRNADRPQQVRVRELIDNVLALYGRKIRTLGVAIDTRYDSDLPVNAFPGELRQVFSNLIVNAADALEKSGDTLCIHVSESMTGRISPKEGYASPFRIMDAESHPRNERKSLSRSIRPKVAKEQVSGCQYRLAS
jgi:hypothetical protein